MHQVVTSGLPRRRQMWASFTLVELLVVMAIIAILAALTLAAASAVMTQGARSRAKVEVQGLSTALEDYKVDNGIYPTASSSNPTASSSLLTNTLYYGSDPSTPGGLYQISSQVLYYSLSGKVNFTDPPVAGVKSYYPFKKNQVGTASGASYAQDPWGYSYGYSTGSASGAATPIYPYSGSGFFDLWSTGGTTGGATGLETNQDTWVKSWK